VEGAVRQASARLGRRGALSILALAVVTCVVVTVDPQVSSAKEHKVSDLAKKIGLVLPETMRVMGVREEAGIDQLVQLKLETDSSGFDKFLAANRLDRTAFEDIQRALLLPDAGWWDPSKAASLPTIQIRRLKGPTLNIGYAPKPGGAVDLYIMWFTT